MKRRRMVQGVVTAIGTPLGPREELHEVGMRRQVCLQLEAGVDALLVLGSMGAMQMLPDETCRAALRVAVDEAAGRVPVLAGCGDTGTERTRARVRWAEETAADGVALVPPYFFRFTAAELLHHFESLAGDTDLPVYLYDNPYFTKHDLGFDLIVQLSRVRNIVGLKASGDFDTLRRAAEHFAGTDFSVLSGHSTLFDVALGLGARGIVDGLFAAAPEIGVEIWRAMQAGDGRGAARAQQRLQRFAAVVSVDSIFGGFTAAMNLRGVPGNFAPQPFTPITPQGRRRVRKILNDLNFLR